LSDLQYFSPTLELIRVSSDLQSSIINYTLIFTLIFVLISRENDLKSLIIYLNQYSILEQVPLYMLMCLLEFGTCIELLIINYNKGISLLYLILQSNKVPGIVSLFNRILGMT
jgi:hypothetical protein